MSPKMPLQFQGGREGAPAHTANVLSRAERLGFPLVYHKLPIIIVVVVFVPLRIRSGRIDRRGFTRGMFCLLQISPRWRGLLLAFDGGFG